MVAEPYPIIISRKKNRKRIQLECSPDFTIAVQAPLFVSKRVILDFVSSKQPWIQQRMMQFKQGMHLVFPKPITFGSKLYYLGKPYTVVLMTTSQPMIYFEENNCIICFSDVYDQEKLHAFVTQWYRDCATTFFKERLDYWAEKMTVDVTNLHVKKYKSRWGCCSRNGAISLNWLLIKAPPDVIDYVIIHECAHLEYFDHSKDFWLLVQKYMPSYKEKKKWLKEYGLFLLQNH